MIKKILSGVVVPVLIAVAASVAVQAQTTAITGHVKDPQGANLPAATMKLQGPDRTFSLVTSTDSNGEYSFKNLAPGDYILEAEASGFTLAAQSVNLKQRQTVDLRSRDHSL